LSSPPAQSAAWKKEFARNVTFPSKKALPNFHISTTARIFAQVAVQRNLKTKNTVIAAAILVFSGEGDGGGANFLKKVRQKLFGKKFYRLTRYSLPQRSFANCLGALVYSQSNSSRWFSKH
jgi:hypothetical protein